MDLNGKVILISGATGGIGKEIGKLLSNYNCKLALFSRRREKLKEISDEITKNGTDCIYKKCDVKNSNDIKNAIEFTNKKYGKINIAILTAGILVPNPIQTFDSEIIKNSMEINFMGNIYFIEHLLPIMRTQKEGTIVVTSTLPDRRGVPGWGAYGASKAALSWFIESLRAEAKQIYNINFITIKPGSVETPMIEGYNRKGAIQAFRSAEFIIDGVKKDKKVIQFPFRQVLLIRTMDMFPVFVYDKLDIEKQKGEGYPIVSE